MIQHRSAIAAGFQSAALMIKKRLDRVFIMELIHANFGPSIFVSVGLLHSARDLLSWQQIVLSQSRTLKE